MPPTIDDFPIHFEPEAIDELLTMRQFREAGRIVKPSRNSIEDGAEGDEISLWRFALSWLLRDNLSECQGLTQRVEWTLEQKGSRCLTGCA